MKDLIVELFNLFLGGNLLSAAAMTRSLMDCYAYLSVLKREKDENLLADWFVCSLFAEMKNWPQKERDKMLPQVRRICEAAGSDYEETVRRFVNGYQDAWLKKIFPTGKITFKRICDHLCEPEMSEDYREACAFVHGQSIVTKMIPFLTYASIYKRLYLMMKYIFKAIRLYPVSGELEEEMQELEAELLELGEAYSG